MNFPDNIFYTQDHEWVSVSGSIATIGVTDHAQGELGDIIYLDFSAEGNDVSAGDSIGTIEAVKTVAELYSPLSGKVISCNKELNDAPESVNRDPYGSGWMAKIEMSNPAEVDGLMKVEAYKALVGA